MRQQKNFNIANFLKFVLIVTGILALIEVAVIYFTHSSYKTKKETPAVAMQPKTAIAPIQTKPNGPKVLVEKAVAVEIPALLPDTPVAKPQVVIAAPVAKPLAAPVAIALRDTTKKAVAIKVAKKQNKLLSEQRMQQILNDVKLEKTKANSFSNCIQIRKTNSSNVTNAFKVADFLRTKGYSISGRMTVNSNQKGITVNPEGSCITITIGSI
jgi:hypothetical protein